MIAGNQKLTATLKALILTRRIPHFIILEGPEGIGKRTLARQIAAAALCKSENTGDIPCGLCGACIKNAKLIHPDIFEMSGTGPAGSFPVESIRELRQEAFIIPSESDYKFIMFFGADTMSPKSQNALLKILEEPPSYAVFIITCRSASSLLPTVRSRAAAFALSPVEPGEGEDILAGHFPEIDRETLSRTLSEKSGNLGEAICTLKGEGDENASSFAETFAALLLERDELPLLLHAVALERDRALSRNAVKRIHGIFRDAIVYKNGGAASGETAKVLASSLSSARLISALEAVSNAEKMLERNIYGALFATHFPASVRQAIGK